MNWFNIKEVLISPPNQPLQRCNETPDELNYWNHSDSQKMLSKRNFNCNAVQDVVIPKTREMIKERYQLRENKVRQVVPFE